MGTTGRECERPGVAAHALSRKVIGAGPPAEDATIQPYVHGAPVTPGVGRGAATG